MAQPEQKTYTIELDCAPGATRPTDLLPGVIEGLGLTLGDPVSRFFGNFVWLIPADQQERYLEVRETVKARVGRLYEAGMIRYGSW